MTPTIRQRIAEALCRLVGHRLHITEYDVSCRRCKRLLAGPLNRRTPPTRHRWDR